MDGAMDIVVVDDDHAGLELLRMMLEAEGYTVRGSRTAAGAWELLVQHAPDALVTDLMMGPDRQDGIRLIGRVRACPDLAGLPVLAVTGMTSGGDWERATAAGADVCMGKPFDVAEFLRVLREVTPPRSSSDQAV
jgi:CheY-like chemotaxis protein